MTYAKHLMTEAALATLRGDPDAVQKAEAAIRAMDEQNSRVLSSKLSGCRPEPNSEVSGA